MSLGGQGWGSWCLDPGAEAEAMERGQSLHDCWSAFRVLRIGQGALGVGRAGCS